MIKEDICEVCGASNPELHHIIFRSTAPYMANIKINFKYLCPEHHRGDKSPHNCRKTDLEYKAELQEKLLELLDKKFYSEDEIREILGINKKQADKIFRRFRIYPEGYDKDEIIMRLMGGRLYD